uniref:Putative da-p36 protein n=1 Tax=Rhipicephalus pulchellus TaxID=72859 RepID=L7LTH8_RHIPC
MKPTFSVGLMLFAVVLNEALTRASSLVKRRSPPGTSKGRQFAKQLIKDDTYIMLNLTTEVERYIKNYIGYKLVDYSLTDRNVDRYMPTVTASAGNPTYGDGCKKILYTVGCRDIYVYYIYHGISTPFNISTNLTLPFTCLKNDTLPADINNAGCIYWDPENLTLPLRCARNYSEEKCNFSVEVKFTGSFAYQVESSKGDKPQKGLWGIGNVADINRTLVKYANDVLAYNVTGVLAHRRTCNNK